MGDQVGKGGILSGILSCWRIRKALPHLDGRILDFGCGRGNLAPFVEPHNYIGVDSDEESLSIARRLHPNHTFRATIPNNEAFDTIVALAVIEHITNPIPLILSLASLLVATGNIVITTPHPKSENIHRLGSQIGLFSSDAHEEHSNLYDYQDMRRLAEKTDLKILKYECFMLGLNQLIIMKCLCGKSLPT